MSHQRVPQILDATSRVLARWGMDGLTLEKVADEAGLSRSLVRHFVGNRDDLIASYRQRLFDRYSYDFLSAQVQDGETHASDVVLEILFDGASNYDDFAAIDAIIASSHTDPALRADILTIYRGLETAIANAVRHDHPEWESRQVESTAYQVLSLAYGHWTMYALGFPDDRRDAARDAIRSLLQPNAEPSRATVQTQPSRPASPSDATRPPRGRSAH